MVSSTLLAFSPEISAITAPPNSPIASALSTQALHKALQSRQKDNEDAPQLRQKDNKDEALPKPISSIQRKNKGMRRGCYF
ncbi:hypothetical protein C1H46_016786 [Malus baccata]|uniref:Uncharacterized protein n=1 Tax=Malus baccata TaxID=106549 RepID=A0A540MGA8_MALBA|nr:hypothetical protein C1H46_016786 [Malus baccata]